MNSDEARGRIPKWRFCGPAKTLHPENINIEEIRF